ncbi:Peroxin-3 [Polychytrium aggregatum]|uniref:Peroxin-3 n=1 Tax=Polychytrium aggregatum TaxID=110093 RepID=UPI0022FE9AB7|nr:Peroxin-3 [Polychytrium aggregatum]KAI9199494.1 Peroxin-3 [Polychytrium aggregatum]
MNWVWDTTQSFLSRNRKRLAYAGGIAATGYTLYHLVRRQWRDYEKQSAIQRTAKQNLKCRFEQNQHDCAFTVRIMIPAWADEIAKELGLAELKQQLQSMKKIPAAAMEDAETTEAPQKSKAELWNEMKTATFIKAVVSIYFVSLLTLFVDIQLNLVGRHTYLESVHTLFREDDGELEIDEKRAEGLSVETRRQFLSFSWYFLNVGWKSCLDDVRRAVESCLSEVSPRSSVDYEKLNEIVANVRTEVSANLCQPHRLSSILFPPKEAEPLVLLQATHTMAGNGTPAVSEPLRDLLAEAQDFVESTDFLLCFEKSLDAAFDLFALYLQSELSPEVNLTKPRAGPLPGPGDESTPDSPAPSSRPMPLAAALPRVERVVDHILASDTNRFIEAISVIPEVKALSAIVFTGWPDFE